MMREKKRVIIIIRNIYLREIYFPRERQTDTTTSILYNKMHSRNIDS